MFKKILQWIIELFKSRMLILGIFFMLLMGILIRQIFQLQIVKGEDYLNRFTYRIQKDTEIESPRGTIYDCNGKALAYNKLSYAVTVEDSTLLRDNQTKNTMVEQLIHIIERTGNELIFDLPLALDEEGDVYFTAGENTILRFKKDVYSTEQLSQTQIDATAEEVYQFMRGEKLFNLDEKYTDEEALKILSVRFDLYMKRYEKYLSVTIAKDVNEELVAAIKENAADLPGVEVKQSYTRIYEDSKYYSNIIGYIGSISEDELSSFKEEGITTYSQNDLIGKTGIEANFEETLKGEKGSQKLYVNSLGSILEVAERKEATPGNDIYLSIDSDFQKAAYDMLEERIAGILLYYMTDTVDAENKAMMIPIKDYYFALIDNNIIDLKHTMSEDATDIEKDFYQKYISYQTQILSTVIDFMHKPLQNIDKEFNQYMSMIYSMLREDNIINISKLSDTDEMLVKWNRKKLSFYDLLHYAISKDIVDIQLLNLENDYLDTEDIYQAILDYIIEKLPQYEGFEKKLYECMLENDYISGKEIALVLYEQGILEKDDDYQSLLNGSLSAYNFMYKKIYNMEITPDMLALAPCSGSFIVTDIHTGKVKAMVSYPGYDANRINEVKYFSSLVNNASSPFYNRVTQQALAPGSTYKIISAIAGLEEGVITEDTYITDRVEYKKVEPHAYCWFRDGHGTVNVVDAIKYSCNYFFYELGYRLGEEKNDLSDTKGLSILSKYAEMFGLNETTGIELNETTPKISDESVVRSAIGQGTNNYTAAQLVRYIMAVANSGDLYKLTVIDKIADKKGETIEEHEAELTRKIDISEKTWDLVHTGMYKVCNESSYKSKMGNLGVTLAGKSGTAQESTLLPDHGLFAGYAPYENPEIAAVVVIPNGYGSSNVLDLYADLICYYYNIQNTNKEPEEPNTRRHADIPVRDIEAD